MNDKEKILYFLKYRGLSKNAFYTKTGLSVGFLDKGKSIGVDKLRQIIDNYQYLSPCWVVSSKGDMLNWNDKNAFIDGKEEVVKRLSLYLAHKGESTQEANHRCGWSRGNLQQRIDKKQIEANHLFLLTQQYPDLNPQWLMIGDGEMLKDSIPKTEPEQNVKDEEYNKLLEECIRLKAEIKTLKTQLAILENQNKTLILDKSNQQTLIDLLQTKTVTEKSKVVE